jgi:hypothetical protein
MMYLLVPLVLLLLLLLLLLVDLVAASDDDKDDGHAVMERMQLFACTTALLFAALPGLGLNSDNDTDDEGANNKRRGRRDKARNRVCHPVSSIFREHALKC